MYKCSIRARYFPGGVVAGIVKFNYDMSVLSVVVVGKATKSYFVLHIRIPSHPITGRLHSDLEPLSITFVILKGTRCFGKEQLRWAGMV